MENISFPQKRFYYLGLLEIDLVHVAFHQVFRWMLSRRLNSLCNEKLKFQMLVVKMDMLFVILSFARINIDFGVLFVVEFSKNPEEKCLGNS